MDTLSNKWKSTTTDIMNKIESIERKIEKSLHHIQKYNDSKQFTLDEDISYSSQPTIDIDMIFKKAWQEEQKQNDINRTNTSLEYDDASKEIIEDDKSGSTKRMTDKRLLYSWTILVGVLFLCSFFLYLK